jgi:glycosyltransferase involved in cell wall biosynthesis
MPFNRQHKYYHLKPDRDSGKLLISEICSLLNDKFRVMTLHKVGILRGSSLNAYEGQYLKLLPQYGFEPIGITTSDNMFDLQEIPFSIRVGETFKTVTKNRLHLLLGFARKVTNYNFNAFNFRIYNLKKLTADLDIIHSADTWYPYTYQAVKTGKPTIVTEWENIPYNHEERPYSKIKKYNHEHVTHFIAITEKAKKLLIIEGAKPQKITVIPAGLDCDSFKPQTRNQQMIDQLGISKSDIKVLFVGRLVPEKGIFDLINAFSTLRTQNVELLVVGSGNQETTQEVYNQAAELHIRVKFLGNVKYSDMPQIHNIADIFCLPSTKTKFWAEQFGYSLVEAMACGKPVVSTFSGSIPEIVKDRRTGILVEPHNPNALASALEELCSDRQLREGYGINARKWVLEKFEANKVAGQIAEVYRKVLA